MTQRTTLFKEEFEQLMSSWTEAVTRYHHGQFRSVFLNRTGSKRLVVKKFEGYTYIGVIHFDMDKPLGGFNFINGELDAFCWFLDEVMEAMNRAPQVPSTKPPPIATVATPEILSDEASSCTPKTPPPQVSPLDTTSPSTPGHEMSPQEGQCTTPTLGKRSTPPRRSNRTGRGEKRKLDF